MTHGKNHGKLPKRFRNVQFNSDLLSDGPDVATLRKIEKIVRKTERAQARQGKIALLESMTAADLVLQ